MSNFHVSRKKKFFSEKKSENENNRRLSFSIQMQTHNPQMIERKQNGEENPPPASPTLLLLLLPHTLSLSKNFACAGRKNIHHKSLDFDATCIRNLHRKGN
jgi:hypothetical protein